MRRPDLQPITAVATVGLLVALGLASCAQSDAVVARDASVAPSFVSPDASTIDAASQDSGILMCSVTTCSEPWATCPTSAFPCDANLLTDDDNCGQCGVRCGGERLNFSTWTCVEGQCTFSCTGSFRNCDKDPSNGCEVDSNYDAKNCGQCGHECAEDESCELGTCVDRCGTAPTGQDRCGLTCTNLDSDDRNCGTCGVVCDPTGPNQPALHSSMYYGCGGGKCGVPKCKDRHRRNCNKDLSDGCEADALTNERCGACDRACAEGKLCMYDNNGYYCLCADGYERCPSASGSVTCEDLALDPENCGACGHVCPGKQWPHFIPTCNSGVCGGVCQEHYADCDRLSDNGCEVNTRVDNRNCGACGNACLPDQVCSEGKCLVAPCNTGETTK
ncbi:MAG: hypothetical protein J0I07_20100 [Myxococcales bacterium]|nr:hypothetical protein [Myxococcales bacterium]